MVTVSFRPPLSGQLVSQITQLQTAVFNSYLHPSGLLTGDPRTSMFTAALFTVAKIWKQPECPTEE